MLGGNAAVKPKDNIVITDLCSPRTHPLTSHLLLWESLFWIMQDLQKSIRGIKCDHDVYGNILFLRSLKPKTHPDVSNMISLLGYGTHPHPLPRVRHPRLPLSPRDPTLRIVGSRHPITWSLDHYQQESWFLTHSLFSFFKKSRLIIFELWLWARLLATLLDGCFTSLCLFSVFAGRFALSLTVVGLRESYKEEDGALQGDEGQARSRVTGSWWGRTSPFTLPCAFLLAGEGPLQVGHSPHTPFPSASEICRAVSQERGWGVPWGLSRKWPLVILSEWALSI